MKTDAELRAPSEPQQFAFTERNVAAFLLQEAFRGNLGNEGLSELLRDLSEDVSDVTVGAFLSEATAIRGQHRLIELGERGRTDQWVRVSPWMPGPRRRAVALWLREQD